MLLFPGASHIGARALASDALRDRQTASTTMSTTGTLARSTPTLARRTRPGVARARIAPTARAKTNNAVEPPSAPRRSLLAAGLAAAATFSAPASTPALDLDALRSTLAENNKDILRMSDPERFLNPAEVELEYELGPPRDPVTPPGVTPGEEGERDVVTLPSGLSYADVELGRGEPLKVADLVVAHVVGTLPDGTEFENTYRRGTALTFTLGVRPPGVCEGLEEGIANMRAGGRRLIAVPPSLGFGNAIRAPLGRVPAGSALRYEVQLLRCLPSGEGGTPEGERICCSDENYPCDPVRAAEEGGTASPDGFD